MAKFKNNFSLGICNTDLDTRYLPPNSLIDAENFFVTQTNGGDGGVGKNVLGNLLVADNNFNGGLCVGAGKNESSNKAYYLVKALDYDYVLEYDVETRINVIVLQSTTGGVLNFITGERILTITVFIDAEGGGNLIAWSGDSNPPRIVNVETAKTWAIDGFTNDEISLMKPSPIFAPEITLTSSVEGVEENFLEDSFLCFATRWKYTDGFYSAPSSWTRPAFNPKEFDLDYQTFENLGMLNLSNAVDINFNVGGRDIVQVDLLFRESNTTTIYVIEQFVKLEQGWADNTTQMFQFSKAKIYTVLPEDQFFRNFDNVPLSARCQTAIGNRIAFANFIEGRDLGVDIDFDVTLVTEDPFADEIIGDIEDFTGVTTYTNAVNFSRGNLDSGLNVDQMDYVADTLKMVLADVSPADRGKFSIEITPKDDDITKAYDITFKDGATVLQQFTALSGIQTRTYTTPAGIDKNVTMYVTSDEGFLYSAELTYTALFLGADISKFIYYCDYQLTLPKSGGYGATLVGDTIIETLASFDMTGYEFKAGTQIRLIFALKYSLVERYTPTITFFYNLTDDYVELTDFLANSGFVYQLETVFTEAFKNNYQSGVGTFVSITNFDVTQSGNDLIVQMPIIVYNVTEPNGTVNKTEFHLISETMLETVNSNAFTSLHSNRDYEVALEYLDEQGRKTTALVCPQNTIYIPESNSVLSNKLSIRINNNPPVWAKYYKFLIKQVKRDYEVVYGNVVYADGVYRWLQLDGESKNKVNAGDLLTIKSDYSGALTEVRKVKVLEVGEKQSNFITGNLKENGDEIIENSGFYMKIKAGDFDINVTQDAYQTYSGSRNDAKTVTTTPYFGFFDDTMTFIPTPVNAGSIITFKVDIRTFVGENFNLTLTKTVQDDYADFESWFSGEIANDPQFTNYVNNYVDTYSFGADSRNFSLKPDTDNLTIRTRVTFDANFSGGTLIFETEPIEQLISSFFETPETFTIVDGHHEFINHVLNDAFNCFAFGNGAESYKVRDALTGKSFSIDSNPSAVNKEGYKRINRYADITYSEIYNSNTNVNKLNEFNLSLANYKDDIQKQYGSIQKLRGKDTNLEVIQEDKWSFVLYGKDLLFNADGTTNLTGVPQVLGQQVCDNKDNGISIHPDSFDYYSSDEYFTDVMRGAVMKRNYNNGLFEISSQGKKNYFKELFRAYPDCRINGKYDQYYGIYILNIKYGGDQFVTYVYSDDDNGWSGRLTFNPEDMIRVNGHFLSFFEGNVYEHNMATNDSGGNFNYFYGVQYPTKFRFVFSQEPSLRKNYNTLSTESDDAWDALFVTEINNGYINLADFVWKEGVWYSYIRMSNNNIDTALLSLQGIGQCTISGLTLNFDFELDSLYSVGDNILNLNKDLVGTILSKTANSLTLNTVNNIVDGDYVVCSKLQSIENNHLLGTTMEVELTISKNIETTIYATSVEIQQSKE